MELRAKKLICTSLMLCLFLSAGSLVLAGAMAAKDSAQTNSVAQKSQEVLDPLEQQQNEALRAEKEARQRQRIAAEFQMLLAKARVQHAQIARWHKAHSKELKAQAKAGAGKKRSQLATTWNR